MNRTRHLFLVLCLVAGFLTHHSTGLKRHGRHRRVSGPDPAVVNSNERRIKAEQEENRHKPNFKRCDDYLPEVDEQSPAGTRVIKVVATDEDPDTSPNGRVTYSIVSTHDKFTIDPQTGWLSTNAVFNRDEPDREKLVHVTVKASDNGRPQLEDVCTLKVKVRDKNDNGPIFDRGDYTENIAQDTPIGTQILRVSATDVDEGNNQKIVYDLSAPRNPNDIEFFEWHWKTGVVKLKRKLDKPIGYVFLLKAVASDDGEPKRSTPIDVTLEVREGDNKPPSFIDGPGSEITLKESYIQYAKPIATYTARSNIPNDDTLFPLLVIGRTEKTNKDGTFIVKVDQQNNSLFHIHLAKPLEYEKVNSYTLTLQVRNSPDLVAEALLTVKIEDENNQAPIFTSVESGNVLEHEKIGTPVMTVSAIDNDGIYPNNRVRYRISNRNPSDVKNKFAINEDTGLVTTKVEFDREEKSVYALIIEAEDGAPSSLLNNGQPNVTPQKFRIAIADKNDNPPYFPKKTYHAEVPEDADVGLKVIEVRAKDLDTEASITTYQIISGDAGKAFTIEEQTGFIRVAKQLDYEGIKEYRLVVGAWDGQFGSDTNVDIKILNVNDVRPQFAKDKYVVEQVEEDKPTWPIIQVQAIDPDIGDTSVGQNITYYMDENSQISNHFEVDEVTGQIRIVKKLDRDLPNGFPVWSTYVYAKDQNGGPTGLESFVPFEVILSDINDNAPFLNMPYGLVWNENQGQGMVGVLVADDYDELQNGPPYTYKIDGNDRQITEWFDVVRINNGSYMLKALTTFDRESQKEYSIPIEVCDVKNLCDVSKLKLIIGDENDNPMSYGFSEIFVYNYEGRAPNTEIGRVYVTDPDDWDLPDKTFRFQDPQKWTNSFRLNQDTGMITMLRGIYLPEEMNHFELDFIVEDMVHRQFGSDAVKAKVNVTIQKISKEAVVKSGSIRIKGRPEDFIKAGMDSKRDKFAAMMKQYLNASVVDVFTVLPTKKDGDKEPTTDIRFAAHGSPYYAPEKIEGILALNKKDMENRLGIELVMIHIDECLFEGVNCDGQSCANQLEIEDQPVTIYTNQTSFVGVQATTKAVCKCSAPLSAVNFYQSCQNNPCLNNGTCQPLATGGYQCNCPADNPDQFGPNCEILAASFNGQGWSWHPGLPACGNSHLSLTFNTAYDRGTLVYTGPSPDNYVENVTDFLSIELQKGKLTMKVNFGSGTKLLNLNKRVDDSIDHFLTVRWTNDTVQMELDDKSCSNEIQSCFSQISTHDMSHHYINTNGPLHVGGVSFGAHRFSELANALGIGRLEMPDGKGFAGCIKNLTFSANGRNVLYDLGSPADGDNFTPGCNEGFVAAPVALNLNMNFLIAILVCLAAILVLVVVLAVYRRKRNVFGDKDIDCDIRENIINYEDEGGGEGDQTGYDLSVLRMMSDGTPALHAGQQNKMMKFSPHDAPDIQTFLQTNKDRIDHDPDATPFDDLRHYAYEGDGNSGGSLSSLNSGTSDGDLEFDYLHNFGPRFKKLADMYGEEPDSDDEPPPPPPPLPSESWC